MRELLQHIRNSANCFLDGTTGFSIQERFPGNLARRLVYCNRTYARMACHSREALMDLADPRLVQRRVHSQQLSLDFQQLIEAKVPYTGVFSWRRADDRFNLMEYLAVPVTSGGRIFVLGLDRYLLPPSGTHATRPSDTENQAWKQFLSALN